MSAPYFPTPTHLDAARIVARALIPDARAELWVRDYWLKHPGCDRARTPSIAQVKRCARVEWYAARRALTALRGTEKA